MPKIDLDATDRKILSLLQQNAKLTTQELASELNLTKTPVFERIKKLEREGYISGYSARLDREKMGLGLMVFCNVTLDAHQLKFLEKFESDVQELQEVVACYHTGGTYDYLLQVIVPDMKTYYDFVTHKLARLDNIHNVQSSFVLKEVKEFDGLPG
ncbi:MAG: Lrp/AsnC family transcriptional regulator [Cyclobacteriaceae bacterium]